MRKKLFVQRKPRRSGGAGAPYLKYLVIAAVCLTFLVIVVPYLLKDRGKEVTKRPAQERGAVTKEIPKLPELAKPAEPLRPTEARPPEPATGPEGVKPPEAAPAPKVLQPGQAAHQKPSAAEPAPKDLFPKESAPSEAPAPAAHKEPGKPEAKAAGPSPPAKPAPSMERGNYAVQVGGNFKSRSQAEAVRKELETKGYRAVVRAAANGPGYCVTTSPGRESTAYTLMEQMKMQGLNDTKVISVAPAPEPAQKGVIPTFMQ